jgi:SAM-dependent methyltransferase
MIADVREYWEQRYAAGKRGSGPGSAGEHARQKAAGVNAVITRRGVRSVVDWGCGDGEVARLVEAEQYLGLDLSMTALDVCRAKMPAREFRLVHGALEPGPLADLALSLDVLYHLVDDVLYRRYLELLLASAPLAYVVSTHRPEDPSSAGHVRHREWLNDLPAEWAVAEYYPPAGSDGRAAWLLERAR